MVSVFVVHVNVQTGPEGMAGSQIHTANSHDQLHIIVSHLGVVQHISRAERLHTLSAIALADSTNGPSANQDRTAADVLFFLFRFPHVLQLSKVQTEANNHKETTCSAQLLVTTKYSRCC